MREKQEKEERKKLEKVVRVREDKQKMGEGKAWRRKFRKSEAEKKKRWEVRWRNLKRVERKMRKRGEGERRW